MHQIKSVCKDCQDRKPGCHGVCEKYINARKELDDKKSSFSYNVIVADYIYHSKKR